MMKIYDWKILPPDLQRQVLQRSMQRLNSEITSRVATIINRVRTAGDVACLEMTQEFDGVMVQNLSVSADEFEQARQMIKPSVYQAMRRAYRQIYAFHSQQKMGDIKVETSPGVLCESMSRPIERVGLYIPAGTAPLVSTALMLGVPSQIAGCPLRVLCSPPQKNGQMNPYIIAAAELWGIKQLYKLGGAQAIAARAYGTETIPKIDKIFGLGNRTVKDVSGSRWSGGLRTQVIRSHGNCDRE